MTFKTLLATGTILVAATGNAFADSPKAKEQTKVSAKPADPMVAMEKAAAPDEHHAALKKLMVGSWKVATKMFMGDKPSESIGSGEAKAILGDRFIEEDFTGNMMGKPFAGKGITGFDKGKGKFVGSWVDDFGTMIVASEGAMDAAGKVLTMSWQEPDMQTGKMGEAKEVTTFESEKKHTSQFFHVVNGKDVKVMEIVYTRK